MQFGRRGKQSVGERQRVRRVQERSGLERLARPISEPRPHLREPALQGGGLFGIAAVIQFHAVANLCKNEDARSNFLN